jgi:uncharacterized protein YjiS (DUF1127 family)
VERREAALGALGVDALEDLGVERRERRQDVL